MIPAVMTLVISGCTVLLLDQFTKRMVQLHLGTRCVTCGLVRLRHVRHLEETYRRRVPRLALVVIWLVALTSSLFLYYSSVWFQAPSALFGLGLAFGGAAGNLLDILRWRCVIDFIDLRWWPVFNLADAAILAGLVLAFWS